MKARLYGALTVLVIVTLLIGIAYLRHGSPSNAIAYLNGQYIVADQRIEDLGLIETDQQVAVTFQLTNVTRDSIRLVGANCSCSCILPPNMPMNLPAGETTAITFDFHAPDTAMNFEQLIELYFDGSMPSLTLSITGATK